MLIVKLAVVLKCDNCEKQMTVLCRKPDRVKAENMVREEAKKAGWDTTPRKERCDACRK